MSNLVRENVVKDAATGELYIPATKRPDGTWRKPVRVKEGYMPQDEVPIYESKGSQMVKLKEPTKKTIPGAVFVDDAKEKNQKKKDKQEHDSATESLTKKVAEIKISNKITPEQIEADQKAKQVRKLKKQLREIEQLEERINSGELAKPEKEQFDKLSKKDTIIDQLKEIGESLDS